MTIRTITFDDEQWQVVPKDATDEMLAATSWPGCAATDYAHMLAAAPEPPAQQPTRDLLAEATEQVEALERENHRMRRCVARLMARLTVWLDDDQFNEADGIMYPEFEPPAQQPMSNVEIDSIWFRAKKAVPENEAAQRWERHEVLLARYFAHSVEQFHGIGKGESK